MNRAKRYTEIPEFCTKMDYTKCLCHNCTKFDNCQSRQTCKKNCNGIYIECDSFNSRKNK